VIGTMVKRTTSMRGDPRTIVMVAAVIMRLRLPLIWSRCQPDLYRRTFRPSVVEAIRRSN
jgi:hypothetical protein